MNSDSGIQPNQKEIININKIFFEDSFVDLLNSLSRAITDLYRNSYPLIINSEKLINNFESNTSKLSSIKTSSQSELNPIINDLTMIKENFKILTKGINDNIKAFKEKAKKIFKEMKNQQNNKVDDIYNDFARKHSLKNEQHKINIDPLGKTLPNNNSNKNIKLERNRAINNNIKNNDEKKKSIEKNIILVKNLINKLGEYNIIIKNHSLEESENFIKIQKQLLIEINKAFNISKLKNNEGKKHINPEINNLQEEVNPFIMVNNNSNNVTMTTTTNNSYYNIIDKDNLKELKTVSLRNNSNKNDLNNELKERNDILEKKIKEYEEEMNKAREEHELIYKSLNDKNTSLSKDLYNKNHEIQILQNSNKLKISEINKLKLILKNNEKQLKVQKRKVEELKEKSPGNIKIKDLLGNKKGNKDNQNEENNINKEKIKKLEEEIIVLKETLKKKNENLIKLEKETNETNVKNKLLLEELNYKDEKNINDEKFINSLISDKDKLINKIKEHKNMEDSLKLQINTLKIQIKELMRIQKETSEPINNKTYDVKDELKKQNNDLISENLNLKCQLEYELNFNRELKLDIKEKDIKIDKLNLTINKLLSEKEHHSSNKELNNEISNNMGSNTKIKRVNTDLGHKVEIDEISDEKFTQKNKYLSNTDIKNYMTKFNKLEKEKEE